MECRGGGLEWYGAGLMRCLMQIVANNKRERERVQQINDAQHHLRQIHMTKKDRDRAKVCVRELERERDREIESMK